jgi:cobalt/nickel transport system permease protein
VRKSLIPLTVLVNEIKISCSCKYSQLPQVAVYLGSPSSFDPGAHWGNETSDLQKGVPLMNLNALNGLLFAPRELHIPDGFLSPGVYVICWAIAVVAVGLALQRTGRELGERQIPLMGVLAAFIFAAQMLNFPVAGGTSGHLVGGALAAILLGPWAAILVMTSVVGLQALLFQDGGLLVLGANILNMAVISSIAGYATFTAARRLVTDERLGTLAGGFAAAWLSVMLAAAATALQLALSGTSDFGVAMPAMLGVHVLIGVGEGLVTAGALAFVMATRRDLLAASATGTFSGRSWWLAGLLIALAVALLSPLASGSPDGLERVAEDQGFIETAKDPPYQIVADYLFPGIENEAAATILAGIVGTIVVFGLGYAVAYLVANLRRSRRASSS